MNKRHTIRHLHRSLFASIIVGLLSYSTTHAQGSFQQPGHPSAETSNYSETTRPASKNKPSGTRASHESRMLQHLLEMDDAQLAKLRETIEHIEKMPPEEKANMRQRLQKMNRLPPEQVEQMRQRVQQIPKEQRDAMRQRWAELSDEERTQWRERFRQMSPEERREAIQEKGFRPPPPHKQGPRKQQPNNGRKSIPSTTEN